MTVLLVAVAGGLGAALRFLLDDVVARHNPFRWPLGTLVVNVTGSLLLGLLTGWAIRGGSGTAGVTAVAGTGFCGGFTTFSTTAVETVRLWASGGSTAGVGYAAATVAGSVAAAAAGMGVWALVG